MALVRGTISLRVNSCIAAVMPMGGGGGGGDIIGASTPGIGGGAAVALSQTMPSANRAVHGWSSAYM